MDEPEQVAALREEHDEATDAYDFARARSIVEQMNQHRAVFEKDTQSMEIWRMTERDELIVGDSERGNSCQKQAIRIRNQVLRERRQACEVSFTRNQSRVE